MGEVSTIGLDIAKSVFQIHGVDSNDEVVVCKRVRRSKLLEFFARKIAPGAERPPVADLGNQGGGNDGSATLSGRY